MLQQQPRSFFEEQFMASLEAADRLGDGDGCLTADEHPDHASFLEVLGNASGGRACLNDARRLVESRLFDESMQNATEAYHGVLLAGLKAKSEICLQVRATILELEALLTSEVEFQQHLVAARSVNATLRSKGEEKEEEQAQTTLDGLRGALRGLYADELRCRSCAEMEEGEGPGDMQRCLEEFLEDQGLLVESEGPASSPATPAGSAAEPALADTGRGRAAAQGCVYGRPDTCPLQFRHVPLLGTHNSGSYPPMNTHECSKMRQECKTWGVETKQKCTSTKRECVEYTEHVTEKCTEWGSECTSWSDEKCGWFSVICGLFCQATRQVCTKTMRVVTKSCVKFEEECHHPLNYIRYTKCKAFDWVCTDGVDASGVTKCFWENQAGGIAHQFSKGARAFDIDVVLRDGELWNGHPGPIPSVGRRTLKQDLLVIKQLLDSNPGEVIYIRWSNVYPLADEEHIRRMQEALIISVFGPKVGEGSRWHRRGVPLGWTKMVSYTLQMMVDANVRLVVEANHTVLDSWDKAVTGGTAGEILAHQPSFCKLVDRFVDNLPFLPGIPDSKDVRLSVFAKFVSKIGWTEREEGTLPCPNGDTGVTEACPGLPARTRTLEADSDETLAEKSRMCNVKNARAVNRLLVQQMDGMMQACRRLGVNVLHVLVDYIEIENAGLMSGILRAIDESVSKFGAR